MNLNVIVFVDLVNMLFSIVLEIEILLVNLLDLFVSLIKMLEG